MLKVYTDRDALISLRTNDMPDILRIEDLGVADGEGINVILGSNGGADIDIFYGAHFVHKTSAEMGGNILDAASTLIRISWDMDDLGLFEIEKREAGSWVSKYEAYFATSMKLFSQFHVGSRQGAEAEWEIEYTTNDICRKVSFLTVCCC